MKIRIKGGFVLFSIAVCYVTMLIKMELIVCVCGSIGSVQYGLTCMIARRAICVRFIGFSILIKI